MGFSYGPFGLCCDFCGKDDPHLNVRKISCPYGYCQSWACCIECKAKKLHLLSSCTNEKRTHKEICKALAIKFDLEHPNYRNLNLRFAKRVEIIK